jgi:preprotein translocase subunit SecD
MKRQFAVFVIASLLIAAFVFSYSSKVAADFDLYQPILVDKPGLKIILGPSNLVSSTSVPEEYILEAQRVVTQRLDQLQPASPFEVVIKHDQLEVTLPDHEDISYLIDIITREGEIEFINGGIETPPVGEQVKTGPATLVEQNVYQLLFTGQDIAAVIPPDNGQVFYQITPQAEVAGQIAGFVEKHTDEYICLVIDKQVINCSKMYYWSGETLDILPNLGDDTDLSLADLAIFLNSGPLPVSLEVITN